MSWSLTASGHVPATGPDGQPQDPAAAELAFYEALRAIISDPKYGAAASSFGGSHVSGSLHLTDA